MSLSTLANLRHQKGGILRSSASSGGDQPVSNSLPQGNNSAQTQKIRLSRELGSPSLTGYSPVPCVLSPCARLDNALLFPYSQPII